MLIVEKVVLDQQVNKIAKNLLLDKTCYNCFFNGNDFTEEGPLVECSNPYRMKEHSTDFKYHDSKWEAMKKFGVKLPEEKTCQYWTEE